MVKTLKDDDRDWDQLVLRVCEYVAEGKTLRKACEHAKVSKSGFLSRVFQGGESSPWCQAYRLAQKIAAELDYDRLRELDGLVLGQDLSTGRKLPKTAETISHQAHKSVSSSIQWRIQKLSPAMFGEKTTKTHTMSKDMRSGLEQLHSQQGNARDDNVLDLKQTSKR